MTFDTAPAPLDLAGGWRCLLDREGVGERDGWHVALPGDAVGIRLPGSIQHQGLGDPVAVDVPWTGGIVDRAFFDDDRYGPYREDGAVSVPFWLQPRVVYRGAAWFARDVVIPDDWAGHPLALVFERVHWESTVWIDGIRIGSERSLTTPHRFETPALAAGAHRIVVRVDNRTVVDVGPNAHSVSDHTQGNWNGIVGAMTLAPLPAVRIARVRVFPDVARRAVTARIDIASGSAGAGAGEVAVVARRVDDGRDVVRAVARYDAGYDRDLAERGVTAGGAHVDVELALGEDAPLWDEFHPALHALDIRLDAVVGGDAVHDETRTVFGLREVSADGTRIAVNGRPTFLRGTLECAVFPLTGYPPVDVVSWRRIFDTCRAHGLNLVRFHSWCPPEAAFQAADETGMYLQVEGPLWANQGSSIGEGRPVDAFLYEETERILRAYGDHPSFVFMAHGNEPAGRDAEFLGGWVRHFRAADPRRLYTSAAGWPAIAENDFDNVPEPRAHQWGDGLGSRMNAHPPETETDYSGWVATRDRPIVSHEIGQWCAYPDLAEIDAYTGLLEARNYGVFADFLEASGMRDQAGDFLTASGRLQVLCYKEEIESALRTEGFGGFHLLGLSDFPGQGTATVGVLNAFWQSKGYCTPAEFARFCGPTVPLARLPRRIWGAGEAIRFEAQIAHFGAEPLRADVLWRLESATGETLREGALARGALLPIGNGMRFEAVSIAPWTVAEAQRVRLVLTIDGEGADRFENDWDLWVYPPASVDPGEVVQTRDVAEAITRAEQGADVLLEVSPAEVANDVALGFTTVFWNTAWTSGQAPHTLGLLHDPGHPVFDGFPTDGTTDWQWWELVDGARALVLDGLPDGVRPLVQPIDTWFEARRLGALVEARVGRGRIVVSSLNLDPDGDRPAARAFRASLLAYMAGARFAPATVLEGDDIRGMLR